MMIMCPRSIWSPSRMIGLASDGANVMTSHHSGIGIRIEKEVEFEVH
jgi:hypothetical protein